MDCGFQAVNERIDDNALAYDPQEFVKQSPVLIYAAVIALYRDFRPADTRAVM
jgi:hypothetical protein